MSQNKKDPAALWDIVVGVATTIVGISFAKVSPSLIEANGEWPQLLDLGAAIVGGVYVYKGIKALNR